MIAPARSFIALTVLLIAGFVRLYPQSLDPTVYFIQLKNADNTVYSMKESVYRLESAHPSFSVIGAAHQKVLETQLRGQSRVVFVSSGEKQYAAEGNPDEFLYDSPYLNLDTFEIKNAAKSITKTDDFIINIERFVKNAIKKPTTGIPLLPAKQVIISGTGDCTEHAVLAIALLRSLKIPARAVVGMILVREFEMKHDIFIYHMWAEAYYKGRWRLVDATSPGEKPLNRYIAFTYHNLRTETPLSYIKAVSSIQDLTVVLIK